VVLGDSVATTHACTGCIGFPDLYGRALARRTGSDVDVSSLAVPDTGVADLLAQVREDSFTRQELSVADVVVIEIGFNDTPWGRGDDPCQVAPKIRCRPATSRRATRWSVHDMSQRMNGPQGRDEAAEYLAADYTHLNQLGHELTARALTDSGWEE